MKKHKAVFIFGEGAVALYEENPNISIDELTDYGNVEKVSFDTEAELKAYEKGLNDGMDWGYIVRAYNLENQ